MKLGEKIERITITTLQVEALKLQAKGYSQHQIAKKLDKRVRVVHRALKRFKKVYPLLFKFVVDFETGGYLAKADSFDMYGAAARGQEQRVREGYFLGVPPFGYKMSKGMLVINPKRAEIVKRIFKGRYAGKTVPQLSRETKVSESVIQRMLRNPVYIGKVGQVFRGKHKPIIDEKTWKAVQPPENRLYSTRTGSPPLGYRWKVGRLVVDPEGAEKVREIFKLRLEGKSFAEIARRVGLNPSSPPRIIRKPLYIGKVKKDGDLVDAGVERIIKPENWLKAQRIRRKKWEAAVQKCKRIGIRNRNKILNCLPATGPELRQLVRLSRSAVDKWLRRLRDDYGLIEKQPDGKWQNKNKILTSLSGSAKKSVFQIARETGLAAGTVRRHLYRLEENHFVERIPPERNGAVPSPTEWRIRT